MPTNSLVHARFCTEVRLCFLELSTSREPEPETQTHKADTDVNPRLRSGRHRNRRLGPDHSGQRCRGGGGHAGQRRPRLQIHAVAPGPKCRAVNRSVTWNVEPLFSKGTVDGTGPYTALAAQGTYTVVATSVANPAKSGR